MEPCKCQDLRQQCTEECVLAPYLQPNKPEKYASLSTVFDISRVARYLMDIEPSQRQACVDSFCFEAEARLCDPIRGSTGLIHLLKRQVQDLELHLKMAKRDLQEILQRNRMARPQDHQNSFVRSPL
ncbi:unnamed protein product [Arabidopsis arenosa]|uniref:Lateral organ boundaries LOB n=2 Tax=Arabidopsis TaxID=3701 RepID=A0A8T2A043_ARASU|nr:Lateral organ boundaries LOB [Arabidopsis suecica]CAE6075728.1 unnamed protein product [Arabidopsis arenosa]